MVPRILLKRHEAAAAIGVSVRQIDAMIADGRLVPVRIGRLVRFVPAELERLAERRTPEPPARTLNEVCHRAWGGPNPAA